MRYIFLDDVGICAKGGPRSYVINTEKMLSRHADFKYKIFHSPLLYFSQIKKDDIVQIHSFSFRIARQLIKKKVKLIFGPNMIWENAPSDVTQYDNVVAAFVLRYKPKRVKWFDKIVIYPNFVDQKMFKPKETKKDIDILTIDKSFRYVGYDKNMAKLKRQLPKSHHVHLFRWYSWKEYKKHLNRSKLLLFPSPYESGSTLCYALLEASMMNVPFIALKTLRPKKREFDKTVGVLADSVKHMAELVEPTLARLNEFSPREWVLPRCSMKAAYDKFISVLKQ